METANVKFSCGIKKENTIYASCLEFNALCSIDTVNMRCDFIGEFPNEAKYAENLHRNAIQYGNTIFFIPQMAKQIHVYNCITRQISLINTPFNEEHGGYIGKIIDKNIFLIPQKSGENIYKMDAESFEIELVLTWEEYGKNLKLPSAKLLFVRIAQRKEFLYLPIMGHSIILILNTHNRKIKYEDVEIDNLFGCFEGKNHLWILAGGGNEIYGWIPEKKQVKLYTHEQHNDSNSRELNWIIEQNKHTYVLPGFGNAIFKLNENIFETILGLENCIELKYAASQKFYEPIIDEYKIWILPRNTGRLAEISGNDVTFHMLNVSMEAELRCLEFLHYAIKRNKQPWAEGNGLELRQFIQGVCYE